jgi:hypothetical protein
VPHYTRRLDEVGADDVPLVGGKAANLGELRGAGFPVPPGFVLTTKAYDQFVTGQVSTDDVVVETATGRVVSRYTAERRVMTGYAEHGTEDDRCPRRAGGSRCSTTPRRPTRPWLAAGARRIRAVGTQ